MQHPPTEVIPISPSPPSSHGKVSEEHLSLEVQGEEPHFTLAAAGEEVPSEHFGPSWMQTGFEMPTEAEALRALSVEISHRTSLLDNIRCTNWFAASFLGGSILDRAADVESLETMGGMKALTEKALS